MAEYNRIKRVWNAFTSRDPTRQGNRYSYGSVNSQRPDRVRFTRGNERSIISAIYNRIALDVASIDIVHAQMDENNRYVKNMDSPLNECLTLAANEDQTSRAFIQDAVQSMFDEGVVAIVPVVTDGDPILSESYDIYSLRTGKITEWMPHHVRVSIFNERTGRREEVTLPKSMVAIVENPFYAVMNEPNSILQRLIRKLNLLDTIDEQNGSGKLDLLIQLPYTLKTPAKRDQAEIRRTEIEKQLAGSKYGIAYIDGTERVTQLNRAVENNLLAQVESFSSMLNSQLGITQAIMDGTADEQTMLNYYSRTVEPCIAAIADAMRWKFLTKTARTQHKTVTYFRDPFTLVPVSQIAEIADKFTRNEIMSSNEIRSVIGLKPVKDPRADELRNKNLNQSNEEIDPVSTKDQASDFRGEKNQNEEV